MSHDDPAEDETARLRRVYGAYAADDATQRRWDRTQPGNRQILQERAALLAEAVRGDEATTVDLGCGDGDVLAEVLAGTGGRGIGVDLLEPRLGVARQRHPDLAFVVANGSALPLDDACVDLLLAFTVFSSIRDGAVAAAVAAEIRRVVRPGGRVVWYDLRRSNPRNPEVRAVTEDELAALFPGWSRSMVTCTVLPPLARRAARVSPRSYRLLARIPALRTHHFAVLEPPSTGGR
jgi:ubiquinone/menaquinone biosynthesis C-methylase UbiE